ncbi:hypothetical protein GCM10027563_37110 [Parasphingorhabdus pacifica]
MRATLGESHAGRLPRSRAGGSEEEKDTKQPDMLGRRRTARRDRRIGAAEGTVESGRSRPEAPSAVTANWLGQVTTSCSASAWIAPRLAIRPGASVTPVGHGALAATNRNSSLTLNETFAVHPTRSDE